MSAISAQYPNDTFLFLYMPQSHLHFHANPTIFLLEYLLKQYTCQSPPVTFLNRVNILLFCRNNITLLCHFFNNIFFISENMHLAILYTFHFALTIGKTSIICSPIFSTSFSIYQFLLVIYPKQMQCCILPLLPLHNIFVDFLTLFT